VHRIHGNGTENLQINRAESSIFWRRILKILTLCITLLMYEINITGDIVTLCLVPKSCQNQSPSSYLSCTHLTSYVNNVWL